MSTAIWILLGILCFIAAILLLYVYIMYRIRKAISRAMVKTIRLAWKHVGNIDDAQRRVLEAEKVADTLLSALGYKGTFAEKLKAAGPRFGNTEQLWQAHKLRNRIAHEPGLTIQDKEVERAVKEFERAIMRFVRL